MAKTFNILTNNQVKELEGWKKYIIECNGEYELKIINRMAEVNFIEVELYTYDEYIECVQDSKEFEEGEKISNEQIKRSKEFRKEVVKAIGLNSITVKSIKIEEGTI